MVVLTDCLCDDSGGWSDAELAFLTEYAIEDSGGAAIIGGHSRPADAVADYFLWLSYFPGEI